MIVMLIICCIWCLCYGVLKVIRKLKFSFEEILKNFVGDKVFFFFFYVLRVIGMGCCGDRSIGEDSEGGCKVEEFRYCLGLELVYFFYNFWGYFKGMECFKFFMLNWFLILLLCFGNLECLRLLSGRLGLAVIIRELFM